MKYKQKDRIVEAKQMPLRPDENAVRDVAIWMMNNGYDADPYGDISEADMSSIAAKEPSHIYTKEDGTAILLPEFGTNYLQIIDPEDGWESDNAGLGDYIQDTGWGRFEVVSAEVFENLYEETE